MKKFYLSKNYKEISSAGNKAKTDIEQILVELGFKNAGIKQTINKNNISGFFLTLISVLKLPFSISKDSILVLQYPFKKYYNFACRMAHLRGCKVITVIHDLGTFRRQRLTAAQEIKRLSFSDFLIVHNRFMEKWLSDQGYRNPMTCLEIFDYLSKTLPLDHKIPDIPCQVIYAGGLSYKKNRFLYALDTYISKWYFNLYGSGFEKDRIKNKDCFNYLGFVPSDQLIATAQGDYGLVWDGESITTCSGNFGEYLKYNNPHKMSLYIRCHLPVIIWKQAALASFVEKNGIGICINSLQDLKEIIPSVSRNEYVVMKENTIKISERLSTGYYLKHALNHIEKRLEKE
ncbi:galactofuranosyltransferase [Parabacteroides sp. Marseille-P3160]|uniref:galactofuranosyltransferase n=1 Tax=Parabacteroides sp. Marseille-P3160 TaxID=1917887 RepID=UPI0009BC29C3|nr:galactofuranosyltransferase [Parabacteroides sp. Marseille-P3160]